MEGYLLKWVNPFQRWQKRYFILNDNILTYCDQPGGRSKGQIHLKVAGINESKDDQLKIIINTGTGQILLKASNKQEKTQWLAALKQNQEFCQRHQILNYGQRIQELLTEVWTNFALFDENLSLLQEKANMTLYEPINIIMGIGQQIKNGITLCCTLIEEEKIKLFGQSDTIYESFDFENEIPIDTQQSSYSPYKRLEESKFNDNSPMNIFLESIKLNNPIKYRNLKFNRVYQRIQLTNDMHRTQLPYKQDPDEKFAFWPFLKECIGKDLTRIPMPLLFHQPLSALQFFGVSFEYYDLLKKACETNDSCKKLAYLMAFSLIRCIHSIYCQKKFFNPVLGETYEYITPEYKIISEQVSHHPPISAYHCESDDFSLSISMEATVGFSGTSIKAILPGLVHFKIKKTNEHITYSLPNMIIKNLLWGKTYFEQVGEAIYTNHTTGDIGILTLKERDNEKNAHKVDAIIKDKNGTIKYTIKGFFDREIYANDELIWKINPVDPETKWYYSYSQHILSLNHINEDILRNIPSTDSRMRSDMRALEYGWKDLGQEEKVRIEEKQRERRKEMEERKEQHIPRFFKQEIDPISKRQFWFYLGNYEREKHLIDLDLF